MAKSLAENLVYRAMEIVKEKTGKGTLEVFGAAKNIMPILEVKARRVGCQLSGAYRSAARAKADSSYPLADQIFQGTCRTYNGETSQ